MKKILLVVLVMGVLAFAPTAKADGPLVVSINTPNSGLSGTPGPYATVTVTLVGSTIHISVVGAAGFTFFGGPSGNSSMFGFNIVGSTTGLAISNCTSNVANGCGSDPGIQDGGSGQMDGFGTFEKVIGDLPGNSNKAFTNFAFDVTRTGGFSSVMDVFEQSCGGEACAHFVIHVAPTNGNPTGFAGDIPTGVPEPGTLLLLGTGLLGLAGLRRRLS